ncbi:hypothetical protein DFH06DRAFT_1466201 [Mycena polygramma]|nr:hypothetical protein DFH06DRAFT_1466201 [Mycena polygramma]
MSFTDLGDDILLTVLSACDVCTVLSVSAVNKSLRRVTSAKQLWLSLIQADTFRDVLELPPFDHAELETHSTAELVELVKRLVDGPSSLPGEPHHTITFAAPAGLDTEVEDFLLLPGARYAVLRTRDQFILYDVRAGMCIWECPAELSLAWSIDFVPGKAIACVIMGPVDPYGGRDIYVYEVDLSSGESREVFRLGFTTRFGWLLSIVDDFFLYALPQSIDETRLVLVNWRVKTYLVLKYDTPRPIASLRASPHGICFIAAYTERTPPHQLILTVTDLESFSEHWAPLTGIRLEGEISPANIPSATYTRLQYEGRPLGGPTTSLIFASALHRGAYRIFVSADVLQVPQQPQQKRERSLVARVVNIISVARRAPTPEITRHLRVHSYYKLTPPAVPGDVWGLRLVYAKASDAPDHRGAYSLPLRKVVMARKAGNSFVVSYYDLNPQS